MSTDSQPTAVIPLPQEGQFRKKKPSSLSVQVEKSYAGEAGGKRFSRVTGKQVLLSDPGYKDALEIDGHAPSRKSNTNISSQFSLQFSSLPVADHVVPDDVERERVQWHAHYQTFIVEQQEKRKLNSIVFDLPSDPIAVRDMALSFDRQISELERGWIRLHTDHTVAQEVDDTHIEYLFPFNADMIAGAEELTCQIVETRVVLGKLMKQLYMRPNAGELSPSHDKEYHNSILQNVLHMKDSIYAMNCLWHDVSELIHDSWRDAFNESMRSTEPSHTSTRPKHKVVVQSPPSPSAPSAVVQDTQTHPTILITSDLVSASAIQDCPPVERQIEPIPVAVALPVPTALPGIPVTSTLLSPGNAALSTATVTASAPTTVISSSVPSSAPPILAPSVGARSSGSGVSFASFPKSYLERRRQRAKQKPKGGNKRLVTADPLSSQSSYRVNFSTIGIVAFFGASLSWDTIFSGNRGNVTVFSWAASCFTVGAIAASGMAIITETDKVDMDNLQVRRFARAFAVVSAGFVFAGVVLLSIAIILLAPESAAPDGFNRAGTITAGIFAIISSTICIATAVGIRFRYGGRYTW